MPVPTEVRSPNTPGPDAARLNQDCFCITLDASELGRSLDEASGKPGFHQRLSAERPHLFSTAPMFLAKASLTAMLDIVRAIEEAARLPAYREAVLAWAPDIARHDHGPAGALMGYDFHLDGESPKLIEVNTNAGGAFLNALLARAQSLCCTDVVDLSENALIDDFEANVVAMFRMEWQLQRGNAELHRIAIVDDNPEAQYLQPEFVLAQQMLLRGGLDTVICDPRALELRDGNLVLGDRPVDLVYNRLVDFSLADPDHAALRGAYEERCVVLTPNPHHHALLAHKRNLTLLSDPEALGAIGVAPSLIQRLAGIPRTRLVTLEGADALWQDRRHLFFKPVSGHGGKAVYRGDKLTRSVWGDILSAGYVAQDFATPGQRMIRLDGVPTARKVDVRLYTYAARLVLIAARIYQGQTTNFRTPGGGFAPVLIV